MKIRIPVVVKDPEVSQFKEISPTELLEFEEEVFLDGPVCPRVAVLDLDPVDGQLASGARFLAPAAGADFGTYEIDQPVMQGAPKVERLAMAVSVFGAVLKTMQLFEEQDALGRKVTWAFGAPQLFVVPRAGNWANAYYERESHSLQLFQFQAAGHLIYTANSQDIIAHETAHALIDGVAPDLYGAMTPQSLAIHEAVADIAAVLASFRCQELARRVLQTTGGSIKNSRAFSGLAEQFSMALEENRTYLRDLDNGKTLGAVAGSDPHALSEVLSGAFYRVFVRIHEELRDQYRHNDEADVALAGADEAAHAQIAQQLAPREPARAKTVGNPDEAAAKALFVASERLKRTLLRGLDYLPPGDATFADLARAVLASDVASHPDSSQLRDWLEEELVARGIAANRNELQARTNFEYDGIKTIDLDELVASDYVAYDFANKNRALLAIPDGVTFEVRPRLDVTKLYWHRDGKSEQRECLFKVAWSEIEPSKTGGGLPDRRRLRAGTTLAIAWPSRKIRAVLTTSRKPSDRLATDELLNRLLLEEKLAFGDAAHGPGGQPLRGVVAAEVTGGTLRVRGLARMLHVTTER